MVEKQEAHGSARFTWHGGASEKHAFAPQNIILGNDLATHGPAFQEVTGLNGATGKFPNMPVFRLEERAYSQKPERHFFAVAPNRSGKGAALIVPNLLNYQGSALVVDPKGENAWITARHRRRMGQKVYILDPWGEVNRRYGEKAGEFEKIACYNPLAFLDPESDSYEDDVTYIVDALIIKSPKEEPHWADSARDLVAGLIDYTIRTERKKEEGAASLPLVRLYLTAPFSSLAKKYDYAIKNFGPESIACRKLARFTEESKEILGVFSTAITQTSFLDSKPLADNLMASTFSFEELTEEIDGADKVSGSKYVSLGEQKKGPFHLETRRFVEGNREKGKAGACTIYLVLPVDKLLTYGRWLRLMISCGIRAIARNTTRLDNSIMFFLDEFGNLGGRLSAVAQAASLMAGLQLCLFVFLQDLGQLKRDYPDDWETFIANAQAIIAYSVMDHFTASYISKLLGNETVLVENISETSGTSQNEHGASSSESTTKSVQATGRALMLPEELRTMQKNGKKFDAVLITQNHLYPMRMVKYFEHPRWVWLSRRDPYYPKTGEDLFNNLFHFHLCFAKYLEIDESKVKGKVIRRSSVANYIFTHAPEAFARCDFSTLNRMQSDLTEAHAKEVDPDLAKRQEDLTRAWKKEQRWQKPKELGVFFLKVVWFPITAICWLVEQIGLKTGLIQYTVDKENNIFNPAEQFDADIFAHVVDDRFYGPKHHFHSFRR
ncbi:MAG: hypothetical protein EOM51_10165 [Clostridia bacterium]|nr:hypothetical protein [Clostridia bacterium]